MMMFRPANPTTDVTLQDQRGSTTIESEQSGAHVPTRPIEPTDAELLMQFERHGDEAAFAELVCRHGPMVMAVCRQSLRRQQDAEDAFQAVWIVLLSRGRAIRNGASLAGWLYRVAHRTALRAARRRQQRHEVAMHDEQVDPRDPLDAVYRYSLVQSLLDEVDRLPGQYRDALVLVYLEGKTYAQAAVELECTTAAVRGRLTRGKRLLRTRLIRQGVSLAAAMGVAHAAMSAGLAQAETVRLVELAGAAATSTIGGTSTGTATTSGTPEITMSETTVSLAEEGMKTMLLTSMTTKLAATAAVLSASIGIWALQDDNHVLDDTGDGGQPVLIALADTDADASTAKASAAVVASTPYDDSSSSETLPGKASSKTLPAKKWMKTAQPRDDENLYEVDRGDSGDGSPRLNGPFWKAVGKSDRAVAAKQPSDSLALPGGLDRDKRAAATPRGPQPIELPVARSEVVERVRATPDGNLVHEQYVVNTPAPTSAPRPTQTDVNTFAEDPGLAAEELRRQSEYFEHRARAMQLIASAHRITANANEEDDQEKRDQMLRKAQQLEAEAKAREVEAESDWLQARAQLARTKAALIEKQAKEREALNASQQQSPDSGQPVALPYPVPVRPRIQPAEPVVPPPTTAPAAAATYEAEPTHHRAVEPAEPALPQQSQGQESAPSPKQPRTPTVSPDVKALSQSVKSLLDVLGKTAEGRVELQAKLQTNPSRGTPESRRRAMKENEERINELLKALKGTLNELGKHTRSIDGAPVESDAK